MKIFLSYASEQKHIAEPIAFSLRSRGFEVFFDRDDLPAGKSYDAQIKSAIGSSDFFIFLISPEAVSKGRYTLSELEFARRVWRHPADRVLPVMAVTTDLGQVPSFLKAVTILEPQGNLTAEVSAALQILFKPELSIAQKTWKAAKAAVLSCLASWTIIIFMLLVTEGELNPLWGGFLLILIFAAPTMGVLQALIPNVSWKALLPLFSLMSIYAILQIM